MSTRPSVVELKRTALLQLSALSLADALPAVLASTRLGAATPLIDLEGRLLARRYALNRGRTAAGYADVAATPELGAVLLRSVGAAPLGRQEIADLQARFTREHARTVRGATARLVAYAYPKLGIQFLRDGKEVLLVDVADGSVIPVGGGDETGRVRWSPLDESESKLRDRSARAMEEIRGLGDYRERVVPAGMTRIAGTKAWELGTLTLPVTITRRVQYAERAADHACFELHGQQTNVWCVAASVQMILAYHRYRYAQTRVATELGLGTVASPSGLPYSEDAKVVTALESLSSNALDAAMVSSPTWNTWRDEVAADRPLISFVPGHSRCVAGTTETRLGGTPTFRGLLVYDPWPPTNGVITQWENHDATTYRRAFTANVKTIA